MRAEVWSEAFRRFACITTMWEHDQVNSDGKQPVQDVSHEVYTIIIFLSISCLWFLLCVACEPGVIWLVAPLHWCVKCMSCLARSQPVSSLTPDWDDVWGWGNPEGMCEVTGNINVWRDKCGIIQKVPSQKKTLLDTVEFFREDKLCHKFQIILK